MERTNVKETTAPLLTKITEQELQMNGSCRRPGYIG